MPDDLDRLLTTAEAAKFLGLAKGTLENWRYNRSDGPPFFKMSSRVRYRLGDLIEWRDQRRRHSTSQYSPKPPLPPKPTEKGHDMEPGAQP